MGLSTKERRELIDLLRKNLLYQTPKPVFTQPDDDQPRWVDVRFVTNHLTRVVELAQKAGGWVLPDDERLKLLHKHEEVARTAAGDGVDYDFEHASYGDLLQMYTELEDIEELASFRRAVATEIAEYHD